MATYPSSAAPLIQAVFPGAQHFSMQGLLVRLYSYVCFIRSFFFFFTQKAPECVEVCGALSFPVSLQEQIAVLLHTRDPITKSF